MHPKYVKINIVWALGLALLASCGTTKPVDTPKPAKVKPKPPVQVDDVDGDTRLTDAVVPLHYTLDLSVDPNKAKFTGVTTIRVKVSESTDRVVLHAHEMNIDRATVTVGEQVLEPQVQIGKNGGVALKLDAPLPVGEAELRLEYTAGLDEVPDSLYRVESGGAWYAFTQFEPLAAREAFPSFDEPRFKVPFDTTLRVPEAMMAAANTPMTEEKVKGETRVVKFATSKPMPTYLVAFAIGTFDVVEAPKDALPGGVPLRILAVKGKGGLARYALSRTPAILATLAEYFGSPYPYAKLDMVAVPNFSAGAMENIGLVTYRDTLLLMDEKKAPQRSKRASMSVISHELAHMWFGNLVTMEWWDDLWLNEAFATWMANRVMETVAPEFEPKLSAVSSANRIMNTDAQASTRPIKKPINHSGDIRNAFDGITYAKGAAVLMMLESWIGREDFKRGLQAYMKTHAFKNAKAADLFAALETASKKPVGAVAARFIEQAGTPLVEMTRSCKLGRTEIAMKQSRYKPVGSAATDGQPWSVPICLKASIKGKIKRACFNLDAPEKTFKLKDPGCADWIYPNAEQKGYYRWLLPKKELEALVTKHLGKLELEEKVTLPIQAQALLESGAIDGGTYLKLLLALAREEHRMIVSGVLGGLDAIESAITDPKHKTRYAALVRKVAEPHRRRISAIPVKGEPIEHQLLRGNLYRTLAWQGKDKDVLAEARRIAADYFKDRNAHPLEVLSIYVPMAAWDGDATMWAKLLEAFKTVERPIERGMLLRALASFNDQALMHKNLNLLLDGTLRSQDFRSMVWNTWRSPESKEAYWAWFIKNYDGLVTLRGERAKAGLTWAAGGFCSEEAKARSEKFFAVEGRMPDGAELNLAQAQETVDRCMRLRQSAGPSLGAFLGKWR